MNMIELTLTSGNKITFVINGNFAVAETSENHTSVQDGNHNNGGWKVKETYDVIIKMLKAH